MELSIKRLSLLLLGLSGILMLVSGLVLLIAPPEDVILWKGWQLMGIGWDAWFNIFLISSILFLLSTLISSILHGKKVLQFLRNLSAMELAIGMGILALIILGTYMNISPITYPARALNQWKSRQSKDIPVRGLQSMSVEELCSMGGINAACCLSLLTEKGFKIDQLDMTLKDLVQSSGKSIEEVVEILKPHMEDRFRGRFGNIQ